MKLYLVQHGTPVPGSENPKEPLSDHGRADCMKVAAKARDIGVRVGKIYHSLKLRAKDTAEAFQPFVMEGKDIEEVEGLKPMDDVKIWADKIKKMDEDVMLVGHLPFMEKITGLLLAGDENNKVVEFHQGGMLALKKDDQGNWCVDYMIIPDYFYVA